MAEAYFRIGRLQEAIAKYKETLEIKPDFFRSNFSVGYIFALKEEHPEAMRWIDKFITMTPSTGNKRSGYLFKAVYSYWLGNLEECNFYLREPRN